MNLTLLKDLTPPLVLRWYQAAFNRSGQYSSWEQAEQASEGYDSEKILLKVRDSLLQVKNGTAAYERDSVLFDQVHYAWPVAFALLAAAKQNNGQLSVLDFGGSLGSTYFQNKQLLKPFATLSWNIVEQKNFVDCGNKNFANSELTFFEDIDSCLNQKKPNVVLLSSVLQYLKEPYQLLAKLASIPFQMIIIDRTLVAQNLGQDVLTVQKVPPHIYPASYPCWIFDQQKLINVLQKDYHIHAEFEGVDNPFNYRNKTVYSKGFILLPRNLSK